MDDVETIPVELELRGATVCGTEAQRPIEQEWEADAIATEKLAIECCEDARASRFIDENQPEPLDRPVRANIVFHCRLVRRTLRRENSPPTC
jgi:hypothetical protein